ncbi:DNA repair protein RecN [Candidatus Bodocaedibacter vickermanii]|uniref:DNA repair protein RecN n=1 Tax=Candidatus Bodocaedibacter vickermanii TaxID=2741701 RepID=A0A7L9RTL9_9PROT|nr:DNA repair protein RecN [Candidatus Paracaedibacteraceae bacterium 'Lake Konstanz']
MLVRLDIENVAIIKKSALTFDSGLTVFTGQTGAGKSILLDSLSLCLGARADTDLIRHGQDKAIVSAVFNIDQRTPIYNLLSEHGIPAETSELVVRRILVRDGNSRCFLNDYPVSLGLIKLVSNHLMEIHQQFDRMLDASAHRSVLDEYAGHSEVLSTTKEIFNQWKQAESELEDHRLRMEQALRDKEYLEHKVKELSDFAPQLNEEQTLVEQRTFIKQKEAILKAYHTVADAFDGDIKSAGLHAYKTLSKFDDATSISLCEAMDRVLSDMTEISARANDHLNSLMDKSLSLSTIEDRLFELRQLARKYKCMPDELSNSLEEAINLLNVVHDASAGVKKLEQSVENFKHAFAKVAAELSERRKDKAAELDRLIAIELPPLKLGSVKFATNITPLNESHWQSAGIDVVEFLVDMNQQGIMLPLNKVASGGEMARLMLALKVCLARSGSTPGLVFDEVDSGVGGDVANAVGQRLRQLSKHLQVLVITHSPQVASAGDIHWVIEKTMEPDGVETRPMLLTLNQRIDEIARMMAGDHITPEAKAAAAVLLNQRT